MKLKYYLVILFCFVIVTIISATDFWKKGSCPFFITSAWSRRQENRGFRLRLYRVESFMGRCSGGALGQIHTTENYGNSTLHRIGKRDCWLRHPDGRQEPVAASPVDRPSTAQEWPAPAGHKSTRRAARRTGRCAGRARAPGSRSSRAGWTTAGAPGSWRSPPRPGAPREVS